MAESSEETLVGELYDRWLEGANPYFKQVFKSTLANRVKVEVDSARQEGWKAGMEEAAGICESDALYDDFAVAAAKSIHDRIHTETL